MCLPTTRSHQSEQAPQQLRPSHACVHPATGLPPLVLQQTIGLRCLAVFHTCSLVVSHLAECWRASALSTLCTQLQKTVSRNLDLLLSSVGKTPRRALTGGDRHTPHPCPLAYYRLGRALNSVQCQCEYAPSDVTLTSVMLSVTHVPSGFSI